MVSSFVEPSCRQCHISATLYGRCTYGRPYTHGRQPRRLVFIGYFFNTLELESCMGGHGNSSRLR